MCGGRRERPSVFPTDRLPPVRPTVCPRPNVTHVWTTVRPSGDIRGSRDSSHVIYVIHVRITSGGGSILSEKSAFSSHLVLRPFVHASAFGHVSQFTRKTVCCANCEAVRPCRKGRPLFFECAGHSGQTIPIRCSRNFETQAEQACGTDLRQPQISWIIATTARFFRMFQDGWCARLTQFDCFLIHHREHVF